MNCIEKGTNNMLKAAAQSVLFLNKFLRWIFFASDREHNKINKQLKLMIN